MATTKPQDQTTKPQDHKCEANMFEFNGDEEVVTGQCGKDATLMIKYEQREWPMNYGTVQFCDQHRKRIWNDLKNMTDM